MTSSTISRYICFVPIITLLVTLVSVEYTRKMKRNILCLWIDDRTRKQRLWFGLVPKKQATIAGTEDAGKYFIVLCIESNAGDILSCNASGICLHIYIYIHST